MAQHFALGAAGHAHFVLHDVGVVRSRPRHFDIFGVREELVCQLLDHRRHGSRKQQRLAGGGQLGTDRLNVRNESHVEHPVRLVDHQQFAAVEHDLAALEQVHQAARRCD